MASQEDDGGHGRDQRPGQGAESTPRRDLRFFSGFCNRFTVLPSRPNAPGFVTVSFSMGKAFKFGPAIEPKAPPPGAPPTPVLLKHRQNPLRFKGRTHCNSR